MIYNMFFCRCFSVKCQCHNPMNSNGCNLEISCFGINFAESPLIVIFSQSLIGTRLSQHRPIVSDQVIFALIDTRSFFSIIVNINHELFPFAIFMSDTICFKFEKH